ncbi:hypothetical protein DFQ26_009852 [Actinomortierella ambigua]|nr:hypothetical protein DFQ26_009852 [Actinomortierella ambigua]
MAPSLPPSNTITPSGWETLSYLIGWAYFFAWSASFYPQAILNWRRKSVQGLSFDFLYLNVLGFLCYSIFNVAFFCSSEIQDQYRRRNNGQDNLVRANDVLFAIHALTLSTFTLFQTFVYKRDRDQRVSSPSILLVAIAVLGAFAVAFAAVLGVNEWIDVLYYLSYIKLGVSFIKYCPQVYMNYAAKSTVGWSIHNILLDLTGGVLSIGQLVLDAWISGDWTGISGDPVKFGLGFLSIAFDLIFVVQHFLLYPSRDDFYRHLPQHQQQQYPHPSNTPLSAMAEHPAQDSEERQRLLLHHASSSSPSTLPTKYGATSFTTPMAHKPVFDDLEAGHSY